MSATKKWKTILINKNNCLKILSYVILINFLYAFFIIHSKRTIVIGETQKYQFYENDNELESKCNIGELNEWDPKIKNLLKHVPVYNNCVKNEPLTYMNKYKQLFIDQSVNISFYNGSIEKCEYAPVLRKTKNLDFYEIGNYKNIKLVENMAIMDDFVQVRCFINKTVVYEYVHSIIQKRKIHIDYINNKTTYDDDSKLNVMILVLDGVSLSSMKRALPKTLSYLKSFDNFYLFEKHHTVGENTFQNLVPMLANLNPNLILKRKKKTLKKFELEIPEPFDNLPFIWKNFSSRNYVTYFSEEWKECTFNNLKFGFNQTPTDYYLRSYWLSLYQTMSYAKTILNSNNKPCYYNKLLHKLSTDWLESFENFHLDLEKENEINNIARFGLIKINEMSHDYLERLFWIDDDMKNLFLKLFSEKYLQNTLFIFMGDHGHRQHPIRQTFIGKVEEKLPMYGMLIPKKIKNRKILKNLDLNTKKLTTWWDVYETLMHLLLDQSKITDDREQSSYLKQLETRKESQKGTSLFVELPNRNCKEANIPEYLCACKYRITSKIDESISIRAVNFMIDYINNVLLKDLNQKCMRLKLNKIIEAQGYRDFGEKYSIMFETSPNNATFDGTVRILKNGEKSIDFELVGKIVRISSYGLTSFCVEKYELKNFCYCYDVQSKIVENVRKMFVFF